MIELSVKADGGAYPFRAGAGLLNSIADFAPADGRAVLISDAEVFKLHGDKALNALGGKAAASIVIASGEEQKNMTTLNEVLNQMIDANIGRGGWVAALGGGVVGDIAGFAAAVYLRGVPIVQAPTTLLAQVDAAIGGKTGVNHRAGKNLIGAFHQPAAVLCDTSILTTLPAREYRAGLAEVVKYGMLGDAAFFKFLEDNAAKITSREADITAHIVGECAKMKANIVADDPRETSGRRALLNLGHTFAHAIETCAGYGEWLHGEAVAAGLVAAAKLSESLAGFNAQDTIRAKELLMRFGLPVGGVKIGADKLLAAMLLDKKRAGGEHRVVIMRAVGEAFVASASENDIAAALAAVSD